MKKALVHDWFSVYAGAEKCVESFTNIWDDFDIYSLIDFLDASDREIILKGKKAQTSFIQKLPKAKSHYRNYLPLFPFAIEQFDVSEYDFILSSSHAVAKGVITHSEQLHICYMYTPVRYAWDLYHQYLKDSGLNKGIKGVFVKYFLHKLRIWDMSTINRVDKYIAISNYVAKRIKKNYNKDSIVIYPPVDVDKFELEKNKDNFYLTASRLVPYKKIDLIVEAFSKTNKKLVVIGSGPDMDKIKSKASKNIEILGYQPNEILKEYMQKAKAFIFAAEEDFGIIPVEAQACGTPVICFGKGGAKETIIDGQTGVHFEAQTVESLLEAVDYFEQNIEQFDSFVIRKNSLKFSRDRFEKEIKTTIEKLYNKWRNK